MKFWKKKLKDQPKTLLCKVIGIIEAGATTLATQVPLVVAN